MRWLKRIIQKLTVVGIKTTLIPDHILYTLPCAHCGLPSSEQWMQGVCADFKTTGQFSPVCTECDILLNEHHLRFFFGQERDDDLAIYAHVKREEAKRRGLTET